MLETDVGLHDESLRSQHDTLKDPEDIFHKAALESVAYNHQSYIGQMEVIKTLLWMILRHIHYVIAEYDDVTGTDIMNYNIDEEFQMSDISPNTLLLRRLPSDLFNGTGPAMREKVYEMQKLYQKHRSQGLNEAMVMSLLASYQIDFDRFCFYGCYCLPDAAVHDKSPGTGRPVDNIDNACHELKMCYQCANRDTKIDAGETCDQLAAYSVTPIYEDNRVVDYTCDNQVNSCRWRICQCDRAFAHKIKMKVSNHQVLGEFDRTICTPVLPAKGPQRQCCGSYDAPFASQQRQIITENSERCCNESPYSQDVLNPIKPFGELCV